MKSPSEELLRSALSDAAGAVRPEELRPLPARVPRRPRRALLAVPLAGVAAAVLAVLLVAPWSPDGRDGAPPRFALASYAGADFVVMGPWPPGAPSAMVRKADTGRTVATVRAPEGSSGFRDSADSGDNRTFVLTTADPEACLVRFHRLALNADGAPAEPPAELAGTALRQRMGEGPGQLAVSPGLRRIAYAGRDCGDAGGGNVTVVDTATGERRVTPLPPRALASSLRWAPDGRELVFQTMGDYLETELRTLDAETGRLGTVSLGGGDATLHGAAFDEDGAHVTALVRDGGRNRIVWYSMTGKRVTRQVDLHASEPDAPTTFEAAGARIVVRIDDRVSVIAGTKVTTRRIDRGGASGP
ncbi:TolB family protein [Actinomadura sediminis]|uniref:TolB family protein n=1 Tax=Actinomadura sediminis TaxID=1038904 RepID=A0ABW3EUM2_9ACTN